MASWQCSLFDSVTVLDDRSAQATDGRATADPATHLDRATHLDQATYLDRVNRQWGVETTSLDQATWVGRRDASAPAWSSHHHQQKPTRGVRMALAGGAWVEHQPRWLADPEPLGSRLMASVPWRAERRIMYGRMVDVPRLERFYDEGCPLPDPLLEDARSALSERYGPELGEPLRTTGLCLYRDGRDSVAWHGDRIGRAATEDTVVAIVSLGATRQLLLRCRGGGRALRFTLEPGDLLVMGGSCQRTWEHAVPKTTQMTGPRVSVQFRARGVR